MIGQTINTFVLIFCLWCLWRLLRRFLVSTPLGNIPGPPPSSYLTGNFKELFDKDGWAYHQEISEKYGGVVKMTALLGEKQLYVFDPKALHHILIQDNEIYKEEEQFINFNKIAFGEGLLSALGQQHHRQRKILRPIFSITHLRSMVPIFQGVIERFRTVLENKVRNGPQEVDVLDWTSRVVLEVLGQCGLGYSFDSLAENETPHPYGISIRLFLPLLFKMVFAWAYLFPLVHKIGSPRFQRMVVDILPWKTLHRLRDVIDILHKTALEIIDLKKRVLSGGDETVSKQIGHGHDLISILLRANMEASQENRLSEEELVGQVSTFMFAATGTSSGALARTFDLLAKNPEVQDRLRTEVTEAYKNHNDNLDYDALVGLSFLDAVFRETLRLYPPVSVQRRITKKDAVLPLLYPLKGVDGSEIYEVSVPKDTIITISILEANRNPRVWGSDSYEWKPERWLSPLPESVKNANIPGVYSHLMTFSGGNRACIGFRFSELEIKLVISWLLMSLRFASSDKEVDWKMDLIAMPEVKGSGDVPALPLVISAVGG